MYSTITVYNGRYCLPGVATFVPQDQDPTVKISLILRVLIAKL